MIDILVILGVLVGGVLIGALVGHLATSKEIVVRRYDPEGIVAQSRLEFMKQSGQSILLHARVDLDSYSGKVGKTVYLAKNYNTSRIYIKPQSMIVSHDEIDDVIMGLVSTRNYLNKTDAQIVTSL